MKDNQIEVSTFLLTACKRILRTFTEYVDSALDGCDLSPNEVIVLSCLNREPATASHIAQEFEVSKALVSRSVKRLKTLGLIKISISESDKREQMLSLSEEGKNVANKIDGAVKRFSYTSMRRMGEDERNTLRLMLKIIIGNLDNGG